MKAVIQRVKRASVSSSDNIRSIGFGLVVFVAVAKTDAYNDVQYLVRKTVDLRIFSDPEGKFNYSLKDINGELLVIPQFTLYGDCSRGRRPSFDESAPKKEAQKYFDLYMSEIKKYIAVAKKGFFGCEMEVELVNDGPVTLIVES
ncbi:MAG: D-aminoacyl-tRNA deacylase [Elusimicrobiota bacterium]